jgi:hypothetical protein
MPAALMRPTESDSDLAEAIVAATMRGHALQEKITTRPGSVFFYPAGLYDNRPLRHFGSLCDTFIYCDVALDEANFVGGLQAMVGADLAGQPEEVAVEGELGLGNDDRPEWLARYLAPGYIQAHEDADQILRRLGGPWGRQFKRAVERRELTIYCFRAEACRCYTALFTRHNAAPRAVCLVRHIEGHRRLLGIDNWDSPLGRAVADSPQPELVVRSAVRHDDWPWEREWGNFDNGEIRAYLRQHPVTPPSPE